MAEKKAKTIFPKGKFEYLIFETGYTSRIPLKLFDFDDIRQNIFSEIKKELKYIIEIENGIEDIELFCIKDAHWEEKKFKIDLFIEDSDREEYETLAKFLHNEELYSCIIFKYTYPKNFSFNDIVNMTEVLKSLHYCAYLDISNLFDIQQIDNILIMHYDTESG